MEEGVKGKRVGAMLIADCILMVIYGNWMVLEFQFIENKSWEGRAKIFVNLDKVTFFTLSWRSSNHVGDIYEPFWTYLLVLGKYLLIDYTHNVVSKYKMARLYMSMPFQYQFKVCKFQ